MTYARRPAFFPVSFISPIKALSISLFPGSCFSFQFTEKWVNGVPLYRFPQFQGTGNRHQATANKQLLTIKEKDLQEKTLATTWCRLEMLLYSNKVYGFKTKRAAQRGQLAAAPHVAFIPFSGHVAKVTSTIDSDKLHEIYPFLPRKFAYTLRCNLLYSLNRHICSIEIHSSDHNNSLNW